MLNGKNIYVLYIILFGIIRESDRDLLAAIALIKKINNIHEMYAKVIVIGTLKIFWLLSYLL